MAKKKNQRDIEVEEKNAGQGNQEVSDVNLIDAAWNFLSSMKLGIILLLVLAIVSIVGTIWIPTDQYGNEDYVAFYNSWFVKLLMGLLILNLLICSLNRWKSITNTLRGPKSDVSVNFIKNLKSADSFKLKTAPTEAADAVKGLLRKKGYRIFETIEGETVKISSDKGHLGILGPYITHLSFLVILVAMIIKFSGLVGFEGRMAALEGQTSDLTQLAGVQGTVNPEDNFQLKINDFRTEYRPDGSVKQWYSDVTVIDDNKTYPYSIYVNNPLVHKGIKFYQSSYGYQFSGESSGTNGTSQPFTVGMEEYIQPTGTDITFIPIQYSELTKKITVVTYKGQQGVKQEDVPVNTPYKYEQATVNFKNVDAYTVLTVKKDPGVPIVGVGSLLLTIGVIMSFILRQRRIWAIVTPEKEGSLIQLGGQSTKDKRGVDSDIEEIADELKE